MYVCVYPVHTRMCPCVPHVFMFIHTKNTEIHQQSKVSVSTLNLDTINYICN